MLQRVRFVRRVMFFDAYRTDHAARMCVCRVVNNKGFDAFDDMYDRVITDDMGGMVFVREAVILIKA